MSVKLADFWMSDAWPVLREDVARLQKLAPTGKSGTKHTTYLFSNEAIAEEENYVACPAILRGHILIPLKAVR